MTENQKKWAQARDRLALAVVSLGYPEEFAGLLAKQLKSPRAIVRMTAYLRGVRPGNIETIVDEMLAICADTEAWRERIESRAAQAGYNAWLNSETRLRYAEEPEDPGIRNEEGARGCPSPDPDDSAIGKE